MSLEGLKQDLRGVAFTTPAPFSADRTTVLYDEIHNHARWLSAAGAEVFIPCGNTGEYYSLTDEERVSIVRETVDAVGNENTVIAGVAGSLQHAIDLTSQYEKAGADGILVMDLDHTYIHQKGMIEYYRSLAASTDLGVVLYKRDAALSIDVLRELAGVENVVGLKFAVNDINDFSLVATALSDEIVLSTGIAERFAPAFAFEGAEGFTSGIGAFVPKVSLALMAAIETEQWTRAKDIRNTVRPYETLREEPGPDNVLAAANNVPAIKFGMELAGLYGGPVRPPLIELTEENKKRAQTYYNEMKAIE